MAQVETPEEREIFEHMEELAIARTAVRELGDRLSKVEKTQEQIRNDTLEEVALEFEKMTTAFGVDTMHSFIVFVRGMKK